MQANPAVVSFLVAATALPLLFGCAPTPGAPPAPGGPAAPPAPPPGGAPAAPAEQPKRGGIFYLATTGATDTLDPQLSSTFTRNIVGHQMWENLLEYRQDKTTDDYRIDFELIPWLAERWEQPNATTYVFHLRKGVKWHDGEEFTAEDVVFTLERLRDPANSFRQRSDLIGVDKIEALDKYTVRITRQSPDAEFLEEFGGGGGATWLPMISKKQGERGEDFKQIAIGTGPFKVKSFDRTRGVVEPRHDAYWQSGKPYLDGIRIIYGLDRSGIQAAILSQQSDWFNFPDKKQFDPVYAVKKDLQYFTYSTDYTYGLKLNMAKPPFNDLRVRKAITMALDRQELLQTISFGQGIINHPGGYAARQGWVLPDDELAKLPGFAKDKPKEIEEAKRLLAEAGYGSGFQANSIFQTTNSVHPVIAETVANQLRKVGIQLEAQGMDVASHTKRIIDGDFDTYVNSSLRAQPTAGFKARFRSGGSENAVLKDPKLDDLIDRQAAATNIPDRKKLLIEIDRYIGEQVYWVPAVDSGYYTAWQPYVKNLHINFAGQAWFRRTAADIWFDQEKMPKDRNLN